MIINDTQLFTLAQQGLISPFHKENLQGSSVDLTLGHEIQIENPAGAIEHLKKLELQEAPYMLRPGEFILAHTAETIHLPDDVCGMLLLRSSAARAGYEHSFAGWVDPGFRGTLVAELRNNLTNHMLPIAPGMRLLQFVLIKMTLPAASPYSEKGNYQGQSGATGSTYNFSELAS